MWLAAIGRYASSNPLKLAKGSWAGFNWEAIIGISREASAQDLGRIDPGSVKGVNADLQNREASLEHKLAGLSRLVG